MEKYTYRKKFLVETQRGFQVVGLDETSAMSSEVYL